MSGERQRSSRFGVFVSGLNQFENHGRGRIVLAGRIQDLRALYAEVRQRRLAAHDYGNVDGSGGFPAPEACHAFRIHVWDDERFSNGVQVQQMQGPGGSFTGGGKTPP